MHRILHVVGAMNRAGAETLIMNIYRQIDRTKFQFDFLVHTNEKADYDDEIILYGGRIFRIQPFTGQNYFSYKKAVRKHLLDHPEHKIIHNHMTSTAYAVTKQAHQLCRYSIIHTHSQNFYSGLNRFGFKALSFPLRFVGDCFLACSEEAAIETFGKNILSSNYYATLRNAIDLSLYHCSNEEHLKAKKAAGFADLPVFCHVGRFIPEKNHAFLLQTFSSLKKLLPNAVLLLAGRGPLEENAKKQAIDLGVADSVIFLGVRNDIAELLKIVDVFVFPSTNEGLGLAAIEAQAAGATCLLSTGVPDLASIVNSRRIPLELGSIAWAKAAAEAYKASSEIDRSTATSAISNAGFDIKDTVNLVSMLYNRAICLTPKY